MQKREVLTEDVTEQAKKIFGDIVAHAHIKKGFADEWNMYSQAEFENTTELTDESIYHNDYELVVTYTNEHTVSFRGAYWCEVRRMESENNESTTK